MFPKVQTSCRTWRFRAVPFFTVALAVGCSHPSNPAAPAGSRWVSASDLSPLVRTEPVEGKTAYTIRPRSGRQTGGELVRVEGAGLQAMHGAEVRVGDRVATNVGFDSESISFRTPEASEHNAGQKVDIQLLTPDGHSHILPRAFQYLQVGRSDPEASSPNSAVMNDETPTLRVNLPKVPTVSASRDKFPDGSYTVEGLRRAAALRADMWNTSQSVRGWVVKIYVARTPEGKHCTLADRCAEEMPHYFLADRPDESQEENMMMVAGYAMYQSEVDDARAGTNASDASVAAQVDVGAEVVLTGRLTKDVQGRLSDSMGLLEYVSHTTVTAGHSVGDAAR